jgi:hypothetical protein
MPGRDCITTPTPFPQACPNCGTELQGRWCHACGQKRIEPEERTLRWLLGEFVAGLTNFDSKFLRSLRVLFVQPGRLGAEWLAGRRASWTSPIALVLVINLAYFFVPQLSDLNLSLGEQLASQWHSEHARGLVDARLAERGITREEYATQYAFESVNLAKTLIILHVPPFALWLLLLTWRQRIVFVDHVAVSLHIWAAWLAILVAVPLLMTLGMTGLESIGTRVSDEGARLVMRLILLAITLGYFVGTLRRVYGFRLVTAMLGAPVLFVGAMLTHFLYRSVQFYLTFALT